MATIPSHIATTRNTKGRGEKKNFTKVFEEFLRSAPAAITREYLNEKLLGTAQGFMNSKEISNRIAVAQSKGRLTTQNARGEMTNRLATNAGGAPSAPRASQESRSDAPPTNGHDPNDKRRIRAALDYVDKADLLASTALLDPSAVTLADLSKAVIVATGALHAALHE